jgi:hypothetical protein
MEVGICSHGYGVAVREVAQRVGELGCRRHGGAVDEHGGDRHASSERGFDFDADLIVGVIQPTSAIVGDIEP